MRWTIGQLVFVQLILTGCAGQPLVGESGRETGTVDVSVTPAELPAVNPYLQERRSVPAQAQRRYERAQVLIEEKDWPGALLELQGLAKSYPLLSGPCLNLAMLSRQLGDVSEAQHWFQKSISINARNIRAYDEYGVFLREQGRFDEAETIYLQALEQWEASAETHRNIGILYDLYVGKPEQALEHYNRYQMLTGGGDREVAAWIADLQRRHRSAEQGARS